MASLKCKEAARYISENMESIPDLLHYYPYSIEFEQLSYVRWTCYELIELLLKSSDDEQPGTIIENFSERMEEYAFSNINNAYAFCVAHDAAENILEMLNYHAII